jgi:hypothetical protein
MIRRSTWVVFAIFLVVALAAIFLLRSPTSPLTANPAETPSVTPAPMVIDGWDANDVVGVELVQADGSGVKLDRAADGTWSDSEKQTPVQPGQVEQLLSELLAIRVLTVMPTDYALDALALTSPSQKIIISRQEGSQFEFSIGNLTPTGNGYYVRTDNNSAVVVSNFALDAVTQLFVEIQATPTPLVTTTPEVTPAP